MTRITLGDELFGAVWSEGRAMPLEQAIASAPEGALLTRGAGT